MIRSDLRSLLTHLKNNTDEIKSGTVFLLAAGLLYLYFPAIGLAIIAALLVQPLRLILYACTRYTFNEGDWHNPSPMVSNITNIWFVLLLITFGVLPIIFLRMNIGITWSDWGRIPTVMSIISIFVLTWSEWHC
jgi:hypothetical protein